MPTPPAHVNAEFVANALRQHMPPFEAFSRQLQQATEVTVMPGTDLELRYGRGVWRVKSGALRVNCIEVNQVVFLALPGDLIGVEQLLGSDHSCRTHAIVRGTLVRLNDEDSINSPSLLREAVLQSQRQNIDMMRLRSGQIGERVKLLVAMLDNHDGDNDCANDRAYEMPSLRETADIVGSTPESVCRALSAMRRTLSADATLSDDVASTRPRRAGLSGNRASRRTSGASSHTGRVMHAPF